ncbi:MAG: glycoside hydrolase family 97 protein [Bacteroidales bacterium]|nr:glycoside hydrolase family 97 protein [Bacteroidales bacterium]
MKHIFRLACFGLLIVGFPAIGKDYKLLSPDKKISVIIKTDGTTSFTLLMNGKTVVTDCQVGLVLETGETPGINAKVVKAEEKSVNSEQMPVVPCKSKSINDLYNELKLVFEGNYTICFRLYNNGLAYRFETIYDYQIQVKNELVSLNFPLKTTTYFPQEDRLISHYERLYKVCETGQLSDTQFCSLPVYFKTHDEIRALITEADLYDYPGLFLKADGKGGLNSLFPKVILKLEPGKRGPDRNEQIIEEAGYIAKTNGTRTFPWRIIMLGESDADIFLNQMVYLLSTDKKVEDPSWIKPGKVAWDWWNANNIYGVDFESGINNQTYRYYIDFASAFGLDYIILDEGWSKSTTNIIECKEDIDVKELVKYGVEKNVGIILWTLWKPLDEDMENILQTYNKWGVKGVKVDFMQRSDQYMVNYYTRVAETAAKYHLLVDFHGAYKPSGLSKTYPNVLSFEGVKGLENNKWSRDVTPVHDVTLPFTRNVAGPMDYTPGAMDNAMGENFTDRFYRPMSQGTRAHQVAMYIVYESPLQMLADCPSNYYKNEECARFISKMPTTWDETRVLHAAIGDYIVVARIKNEQWYVAAMGDENIHDFELDLSFISDEYKNIESIADGVNANKIAIDYKYQRGSLSKKLKIHLAPGGGYAAIISK